MKRWRKITALLLSVLLVAGAAGCGSQNAWVYDGAGEQMPAGQYIMYLLNAYQEGEEQYLTEKYAGADADEVWVSPEQKELLAAQIEGQPAATWMTNRAQQLAQEYYGAVALAEELGVTVGAEELLSLQSNAEMYYEYYESYYTGNGIAQSSLESYYYGEALKDALLLAIYGEGGTQEISNDELLQVFSDDYVKASYMVLYKDVASGDDEQDADLEERNAAILQQAEGYRERLQAGEPVNVLVADYRASTTGEEADTGDDTGTETQAGQSTDADEADAAGAGANEEPEGDAGAPGDAEAEADTDASAEADTDEEADANANPDTDDDEEADAETDAQADADTSTDTDATAEEEIVLSDWQMVLKIEDEPTGYALYDAVMFDTPVGQATIAEDETVIYVVFRHDISSDQEALDEYRDNVLRDYTADRFRALLLEKFATLGVSVNSSAIDAYQPKKLKFDI